MSPSTNVDIIHLRKAYARGENIIRALTESCPELPRSEIIEIAYDIQSGSYIKLAIDSPEILKAYAAEVYTILGKFLCSQDVFLDCGAGELTTLGALMEHFPLEVEITACDISLSRLRLGRRFLRQSFALELVQNICLFVADMSVLPLADKSVDVVFTSHALEPNHGSEREIITELMRVARRHLLLFEPSWENANETVRARMDSHGYVRDLPQHIEEAGGRIVSVEPLPNPWNPLNPTYCYVVEPTHASKSVSTVDGRFLCPRSGSLLQSFNNYLWSHEGGWAYPEIDGIPCLRQKNALLMSHL